MKKYLAGLLAAALCIGVFGTASAQSNIELVNKELLIRRSLAAVNNGYIDSTDTSIRATANALDTTVAFSRVVAVPGVSDTANSVIVGLVFSAALASGESLYVIPQGSVDGGETWHTLGVGTIPNGGSITGQVTSLVLRLAARPNSTTSVSGISPALAARTYYAGWEGWSTLRLIIRADASTAPTAKTYKVFVGHPKF